MTNPATTVEEIRELLRRINSPLSSTELVRNEAAISASFATLIAERDQAVKLAEFVQTENIELVVQRDAALAEVERLREALLSVESLIDQSYGVAGLHLNGEDAPWTELRTDGRFEEWLLKFDEALSRRLENERGGE